MNKEIKLDKTQQLIGELAWIAHKELKNLRPEEVSPVKYSDLKSHMIGKFDEYTFTDREFALRLTNKGQLNWLYRLGWAGTLLKRLGFKTGPNGYWEITEEGEKFLQKYSDKEFEAIKILALEEKKFIAESIAKKSKQPTESGELEEQADDEEADITSGVDEEAIISEIVSHIEKLDPYKFQDLVGYLFEGMGYIVSHIAGKGPDGGVDLIANRDPLGVEGKIVKIQVKHTGDTEKAAGVGISEVQRLNGICVDNNSHGVLISTGGFARTAENSVRKETAGQYVTLIDLSRFIELWKEHIDNIPQEGKAMLPLKQIHILDI